MANKMAIIASNVGAINLLVNEENGFLISPRNTEDLKFAILNYIKIDKESLSIQQNISFLKIKDYFLWDKIIISTISEIKKKIEQFKQTHEKILENIDKPSATHCRKKAKKNNKYFWC